MKREALFRVRDVAASIVGLALLWPLFLVVAIGLRLQSSDPVLFKQERIGRGGRPFTILKFRTMAQSVNGPLITTAGDRRITPVGRVLRATKVDELPQLINVLRGDMGIVGPRPEVDRYVKMWPLELREKVLSVRPGITDPITVRLRDESGLLTGLNDPEKYYVETLLPLKVKGYVDYVAKRSLLGDTVIVALTIARIVKPPTHDDTSREFDPS